MRGYAVRRGRAAAPGCEARVAIAPGIAGDVDTTEDYVRSNA